MTRGRHGRGPVGATLAIGLALAGLVAAQPPDRSRPPAPGPPPALRLPPIQKHTLPNGLAVWLIEHHEVPVVQVDLIVKAGSALDPPGRFGLASLTAAMLDEGAGPRDALAIADDIEYLGAELTTASSFDWAAVRLHTPVARLPQALAIMADVAIRPTFPDHELERLRQERLTRLLQARDDPAQLASVAFAHTLFGPAHRYGVPEMGAAPALRTLTTADLRAFHNTYYRPARATLVLVGDVTSATARPLVEAAFGSWTAGPGAADPALPAATSPAGRAVYLVDKPGAAQSQIRIGGLGAARTTPDYFAVLVMNTILGGSFTSRLNQNLREQHGYTYGAGSAFDMRRGPGPFVAAAGVQTDKTAEALVEFFKELHAIRQPVAEAELTRAKNYLALRFPRQFETTRDIARQLSELIVYDLPDDYFATYVQRIQAVTAADVQKAAERYIQPDRFLVVIAGDRGAIEAKVRSLNLGPVYTVSVDEILPR
jgi:zinc protease